MQERHLVVVIGQHALPDLQSVLVHMAILHAATPHRLTPQEPPSRHTLPFLSPIGGLESLPRDRVALRAEVRSPESLGTLGSKVLARIKVPITLQLQLLEDSRYPARSGQPHQLVTSAPDRREHHNGKPMARTG